MKTNERPAILVISSYPPRVCGIATYTQDLVKMLNTKYGREFLPEICALESENESYEYPAEVRHVLRTADAGSYVRLSEAINNSRRYSLVLIQHEFGLFNRQSENFLAFVKRINVPVIVTFHTVLPNPDQEFKVNVQQIAASSNGIIVMTKHASHILQKDYAIDPAHITVIAHGTHLIEYKDKELLKRQYGFTGKKVLSTFGLISSGKSIETTLQALPAIVKENPDVLFLAIGRTHPNVARLEGETYREMLEKTVRELDLGNHVKFINDYLPLATLLDYLQLTDIYLFTSKDPNQAVSGTFSYAMSCGCPIVSTPIPHARELLGDETGILIDFGDVKQLGNAVNRLLNDAQLRENMRVNGLHKTASTAWENVALEHADLFGKYTPELASLKHVPSAINLKHFRNLTTPFGMIQFSRINQPDAGSGYTLDDNARALIAVCMHYSESRDPVILAQIAVYLGFIESCMQPEGNFLNYMNIGREFTDQNNENLDDANGRATWALGYLLQHRDILPEELVLKAEALFSRATEHIKQVHSSRALAFAIKGLYYSHTDRYDAGYVILADELASRLERMYEHEAGKDWQWFESYLTYGNSVLPESMLLAYLITHNDTYKKIAQESFGFLLSHTFTDSRIKLISNKSWFYKGGATEDFGEQPIDVSYTILALASFYEVFKQDFFLEKMQIAFSWFSGNNHLKQIIYNPCTGGCYDGLEEKYVNLNQGAESTVSYLLARLTIEKYNTQKTVPDTRFMKEALA